MPNTNDTQLTNERTRAQVVTARTVAEAARKTGEKVQSRIIIVENLADTSLVIDQAGDPKFIGERQIPHTPQGSELSLKTGEAFDVTVQPTLESRDGVPFRSWSYTRVRMKYLVRNAKPEPVTLEVRSEPGWGDYNVSAESHPSREAGYGVRVWSVPVPANGETTLTFTADNKDRRWR